MEKVQLSGPAGELEGVFESRTESPRFLLLVGHPHPLYGGTMDNKVVTTLTRAGRDADAATLRFNFRGVGKSGGSFDNGTGETDDLIAAVHWLRQRIPGVPLWLAGFSFGSFVAAQAAQQLHRQSDGASHLLLVAPPVHHYDFDRLEAVGCPVWLAQGDADEVVPPDEVFAWAGQTPLAPEVHRLAGCSHFFHGRLTDLKALVSATFP